MNQVNLNKEKGQKLCASDWNSLVSKINEIIDLINESTQTEAITKLSQLINDTEFITLSDIRGKANSADLAVVATTGSYNDLIDKPVVIGEQGPEGKSAYQVALDNGFVGTQQQWLDSLKGQDGQNGSNGQNGSPGQDGDDGKSAYELAVDQGYSGTLEQWLQSLHGADGQPGQNGQNGTPGQNGITPHIDSTSKHWIIGETDTQIVAEGQNGTNGTNGQNGISPTIQINSITGGHTITITDTNGTNSFNVMDGVNGTNGTNGQDGRDGTNGTNGVDGVTPHIDPTSKHWIIGSTDTGVVAEGQNGTNPTGAITSSTSGLKIEVVSSLPGSPDNNTIYIVQ